MIADPGEARRDLDELKRILRVDGGVDPDDGLWLRLAEIDIAVDGLEATVARTSTADVRSSIMAIGCMQLTTRIASLAVDILGYYALPDEPVGINEPPVAGEALQAIRSKHLQRLAVDETRLMSLRDELAAFLLRLRPDEEEN